MAELDDILSSLLGSGENEENSSGEEKTSDGELFDILLKIMPLIDTVNKESDDERLLRALAPYVSEDRREKLDKAQSLLKIVRLLPLLGSLFGGDEK